MTPTDYYVTNYAMFLVQHGMRSSVRELSEHLNRPHNRAKLDGKHEWVVAHSSIPHSLYAMVRQLCLFHANNSRPVEADAIAEAFTKDDGKYAYATDAA